MNNAKSCNAMVRVLANDNGANAADALINRLGPNQPMNNCERTEKIIKKIMEAAFTKCAGFWNKYNKLNHNGVPFSIKTWSNWQYNGAPKAYGLRQFVIDNWRSSSHEILGSSVVTGQNT
jgi:hypothetical protein